LLSWLRWCDTDMGNDTRDRDKQKRESKDSASMLSRLEWDRLLTAKAADLHLEQLASSGVLKATFPVLHALIGFGGAGSGHKDLWGHTKQVVIQTLPHAHLRWAALFHDCGKPVAFSRASGEITFHGHEAISTGLFKRAARPSGLFRPEEIAHIASIIRLLGHVEAYSAEWTDSAVRRLGVELGDLMADVLAVARADCTTGNSATRRRVQQRCHDLNVRLAKVKELDAIPKALPSGLGDAVMARVGFTNPMTHEQRIEMKRIMGAFKAIVEAGELPRSADISLYMEKLEGLL